MRSSLTGEVTALIRQVAAEVIMPYYQRLDPADVRRKRSGGVVTAADRHAERALAEGLVALLPGSQVIGEEAVAADAALLAHVPDPGWVWLVDPVDGTGNFAAGRSPFVVMVALLRDGQAVSSWIIDPLRGTSAVAEAGAGAYLDGVRWTMPDLAPPFRHMRGPVLIRFLPEAVRESVAAAGAAVGEVLAGHNCAGYEYLAIMRGEQQFAFFWRTLPWDHAPGVLLLREAGGCARHLDGGDYIPGQARPGLLVAHSDEVWRYVRTTVLATLASG